MSLEAKVVQAIFFNSVELDNRKNTKNTNNRKQIYLVNSWDTDDFSV